MNKYEKEMLYASIGYLIEAVEKLSSDQPLSRASMRGAKRCYAEARKERRKEKTKEPEDFIDEMRDNPKYHTEVPLEE